MTPKQTRKRAWEKLKAAMLEVGKLNKEEFRELLKTYQPTTTTDKETKEND